MEKITFYAGNDRPDLSGNIPFDGSPELEAASVTLTAVKHDDPDTKEIDAQSCDVTINAASIDYEYSIQSGDFDTPGLYDVFLTVTFADGDVMDVKAEKQVEVLERFQ